MVTEEKRVGRHVFFPRWLQRYDFKPSVGTCREEALALFSHCAMFYSGAQLVGESGFEDLAFKGTS